MTSKKENLETLNRINKKGKITEDLFVVIESIIDAIKHDNVSLVSDLSSVKSLISGGMNANPTQYPFREDKKYNEKVLGEDVYVTLDVLHHDYAMKTGSIPSGMLLIESGKIAKTYHNTKKTENKEHPIVKKINAEFQKSWSRYNK